LKKRKLKALQNNSAELREEFKMIKREVQREVRRDHERWPEKECKEAEEMHQRGYISGIYGKVKDITSEKISTTRLRQGQQWRCVDGEKPYPTQSEAVHGRSVQETRQ